MAKQWSTSVCVKEEEGSIITPVQERCSHNLAEKEEVIYMLSFLLGHFLLSLFFFFKQKHVTDTTAHRVSGHSYDACGFTLMTAATPAKSNNETQVQKIFFFL